jgi:hypothetical protein
MIYTTAICSIFNWTSRKSTFVTMFLFSTAEIPSNMILYWMGTAQCHCFDKGWEVVFLVSSTFLILIMPVAIHVFFIYDPLDQGIIVNE